MSKARTVVAAVIGAMPFSSVRKALYRSVLGYRIGKDVSIGWLNMIACDECTIEDGAHIGNLNDVRCVELHFGKNSKMKRFNRVMFVRNCLVGGATEIVTRNTVCGAYFGQNERRDLSDFSIGYSSLLTHGHYVDVSNGVSIGDNVVFGGNSSSIWTHGFDAFRNVVGGPVMIGDNVYVGSDSTICQNVTICDEVVIGATTCVPRSIDEPGLYVSSSLTRKRLRRGGSN